MLGIQVAFIHQLPLLRKGIAPNVIFKELVQGPGVIRGDVLPWHHAASVIVAWDSLYLDKLCSSGRLQSYCPFDKVNWSCQASSGISVQRCCSIQAVAIRRFNIELQRLRAEYV